VAVIWNSNTAYNLSLNVASTEAGAIRVFDTMGNEMIESLNLVEDDGWLAVTSAAERPIFLVAKRSEVSSLAPVLKTMVVEPLLSVSVSKWQRISGAQNAVMVTLTAHEDAVRAPRPSLIRF